ncbi:hypothetical protein JTE90_021986 [Oedothorax gibbosus]|uniref:C-type lectin domain-containing protein n=1 Tax=Oedothorax gibbosus TaxID=931172 RepID=A0AAV6U608_9ARAC|nr:hypothetical protein JTE90_021986 [Oedothorax gibbosus]
MFERWYIFLLLTILNKISNCRNENAVDKSVSQTSCSNGWFTHENMCYKMGRGRITWEEASHSCLMENSNLVSVHSKELSDFLTAFFLMRIRHSVWIGLHDRITEGTYEWDDDSPVNFTNWAPGEPSGRDRKTEDCVEAAFYNANQGKKMGQWNDATCDHKMPFICQKKKGNFNSKYLDPRFCSPDLGGGWKYLSSCFHFVNESKTWPEAEDHCINKYKGHLLSILDLAVENFLNYVLRDKENNMWIGIQLQNANVQQWSSGWHVAYENFGPRDRDGEFTKGMCAARIKSGLWVSLSCYKVLPFVCEYSTAIPPTLNTEIAESVCPQHPYGWKDLGGNYCYFFETTKHYTWYVANFMCMERGGSKLVGIHSQEEETMLHNFVKFKQNGIYIGLYRQEGKVFAWADGSPVNFTNWDRNEPSFGTEKCVEMRTNAMNWNDVECSGLKGFICYIPKIAVLPNQTYRSSSVEPITCKDGFSGGTVVGVIFCAMMVTALIGVILHYLIFSDIKYERFKKTSATSACYIKPKDKVDLVVDENI